MATPSAKLAGSLDALRTLQDRGVVAVRSADLARTENGLSDTVFCNRS